jgi:hypothetical protein
MSQEYYEDGMPVPPGLGDLIKLILRTGVIETGVVRFWNDYWVELESINKKFARPLFIKQEFVMGYQIVKSATERLLEEEIVPAPPPIGISTAPSGKPMGRPNNFSMKAEEPIGLPKLTNIRERAQQRSANHLTKISKERELVQEHLRQENIGRVTQVQYGMPSFKKRSE